MDDEKTRTIKRVEELAEAIALERFKAAKATATPGSDLLMKVTGTTEADVLDHIRKEPFVWIAAILCYLEEWRWFKPDLPSSRAALELQHFVELHRHVQNIWAAQAFLIDLQSNPDGLSENAQADLDVVIVKVSDAGCAIGDFHGRCS